MKKQKFMPKADSGLPCLPAGRPDRQAPLAKKMKAWLSSRRGGIIAKAIKRYVLVSVFLLAFFCFSFGLAQAATLQLAPTTKAVTVGDIFNLELKINAKGESIDTARAVLNYPAELIKVTNFSLISSLSSVSPASGWDNGAGTLSYGGFALGDNFSGSEVFATITFEARATGEAIIKLLPGSRLIDNGQEKIENNFLNQTKVIIKSKPTKEATVDELQITSPTHPDQNKWYQDKNPKLVWNILPNVTSYFWSLSTDPSSEPDQKTSEREKQFTQVDDGVWYFNLKAENSAGRFSPIARYRLQIDATAPKTLQPFIDLTPSGEKEIRFGTVDELSGVAGYQIKVDEGEWAAAVSPVRFSGLPVGEHKFEIKAVDSAGNEVVGSMELALRADQSVGLVAENQAAPKVSAFDYFWSHWWDYLEQNHYVKWLILLMLLIILWLLIRRRRNKNKYPQFV